MAWFLAGLVAFSVLCLFWGVALCKAAARADREAERQYRELVRARLEAREVRARESVLNTLLTAEAVHEEYMSYLDAEEQAQEFVEEVAA